MLDVFFQTKFKQDYKRCKKRGKDIKKFVREKIVEDWSPEQISGYAKKHDLFSKCLT